MLLGSNNLFQFRYVDLLVEISISSYIVCYYCFYYFDGYRNFFFLLDEIFYFFENQRLMFRME